MKGVFDGVQGQKTLTNVLGKGLDTVRTFAHRIGRGRADLNQANMALTDQVGGAASNATAYPYGVPEQSPAPMSFDPPSTQTYPQYNATTNPAGYGYPQQNFTPVQMATGNAGVYPPADNATPAYAFDQPQTMAVY